MLCILSPLNQCGMCWQIIVFISNVQMTAKCDGTFSTILKLFFFYFHWSVPFILAVAVPFVLCKSGCTQALRKGMLQPWQDGQCWGVQQCRWSSELIVVGFEIFTHESMWGQVCNTDAVGFLPNPYAEAVVRRWLGRWDCCLWEVVE